MNPSIPWYKSAILRGIIVSVIVQIAARTNLANVFNSANTTEVVNYILDGISAAALAYATHARVVKNVPPITGTAVAATTVVTNVEPVAVIQPAVILPAQTSESPK